jgi:DNA-binding CsgD family transcriptional regulator
MPNQTYDEKFRSLTENEITVLNAKCKGVALREVARRMGFGVAWAYQQMSIVYRKLGIDETLHPADRAKVLSDEVCPQLQEFLKNKPG